MNERIKELAEYAWEYTTEQTDGWINESGEVNWDFLREYDNKFAELLVQECIRQVDLDNGHGNNEWDRALTFVSNHLKEHFGVKE